MEQLYDEIIERATTKGDIYIDIELLPKVVAYVVDYVRRQKHKFLPCDRESRKYMVRQDIMASLFHLRDDAREHLAKKIGSTQVPSRCFHQLLTTRKVEAAIRKLVLKELKGQNRGQANAA